MKEADFARHLSPNISGSTAVGMIAVFDAQSAFTVAAESIGIRISFFTVTIAVASETISSLTVVDAA